MRQPLVAGAMLAATLVIAVYAVAADRPRREAEPNAAAGPRWEYLVVAGGRTNTQPTGNEALRKVTTAGFEHEAFALESNMDKLGSAGWELVGVGGGSGEPIYYFKRPK